MSGSKTISTSETKIEALKFQSSAYGGTLPVVYGQTRIPGNLGWYGDFKAIPHTTTQSSGGKGGSPKIQNTTYTYQAAMMMMLCEGPVTSITKAWKAKNIYPGPSPLATMGLSFKTGAIGQAVWSYMTTNHPTQALGYSGVSYVYSQAYDLGSSASVDNHNFEVRAFQAYTIAGVPDAVPAAVTSDMLQSTRYGVEWPSSALDTTAWDVYCRAANLLMSPAFTEQMSAVDMVNKMCKATNTGAVWSQGVLKFIPYGDATITGNGSTYTPNVTPIYDFNSDHFLDKENPVRLARKPQTEAYNHFRIEFLDRANDYNIAIAEARDQANIDTYGIRSADVLQMHWVCDAGIAQAICQLLLQRVLYIRNTYTFKLPENYALLEPMDLVTLTDDALQLNLTPVRITKVSSPEEPELTIEAEDFPLGVAAATLYPNQDTSSFNQNYNVSPGNAQTPAIFELPGALTATGLELAVATTSTDPNWGGCQVWVSYDGTNYRQIAELRGGSRYGAVVADNGNNMDVTVSGQLLAGTSQDAANLATLCYALPNGGVAGEYLAYQEADLTGPGAYNLKHLVRPAYGSQNNTHAAGTKFVRVDDALARTGALDPKIIGQTVYVKLCSFNIFGGGAQTLADVSATTYTITGAHFFSANATLAIKMNQGSFTAVNYNECWIHGRDASGVAVDAPGLILVNGQPKYVPNGLLFGGGPYSAYIVWDMAGTVFTISGGITGYPYAAVRRYGTQWQYFDNAAWVNFTPNANTVVIGTVEIASPDTGNPGTPPGVVAATMWAAASTMDSLVASAAPSSVTVRGDNANVPGGDGSNGNGVKFSTGYVNPTFPTRGHTLVVYRPATDAIIAGPTSYDTYGTPSDVTAITAAINGVVAGDIVTLYSYDATSVDSGMVAALQACGKGPNWGTWGPARITHVFVGQKGFTAGQAYEYVTSSSGADGVGSIQAYYSNSGLVANGAAGATGATGPTGPKGDQNGTATLWQWSIGTPADPSGSSTYTWANASNSSYTGGGGWSVTIPANPGTAGARLWSATKGVSDVGTATTTTVTWGSGFSKQSVSGGNGLQSATASVYQWAASIPAAPSGTATWTWSSMSFGSAPFGWTLAPGPSPSAGYTLWAAEVLVSDVAGVTSTNFNWSASAIRAKGQAGSNGATGPTGAPGPTGSTGNQGASARYAYSRIPGNPSPTSGFVTESGDTLPSMSHSNSTWNVNVVWASSDPNPSSTNTLYQTDGIYDPATGNTVWSTPYISSLKVGSLSAVTVNTGGLNLTGDLVASGGAVRGGAITGWAWPAAGSGPGFYLGYNGLLLGNYNDGQWVQINSDGSLYMPGLSISGGNAVFSGNLSAAGGTFAGSLSSATGTFSGNLSAAGGTFAGSLSAASGTFSGTLTAAAVNAVNTININGNAVTIPVGAALSSDVVVTGTGDTAVLSTTLDTGGQPLLIFSDISASNASTGFLGNMIVEVKLNGTVVRQFNVEGTGVTNGKYRSMATYIASPGTGTLTVSMTARMATTGTTGTVCWSGSSYLFVEGGTYLAAMGCKR